MPNIDGFELCSRIRRNNELKGTKILIITGYADEQTVGRIKEAGANDIIEKPIAAEKLIEKANALLT